MTPRRGDIWDRYNMNEPKDYFLVTTNEVIKPNGALVMGAGFAKQVRDRLPGFDKRAGERVQQMGTPYGVLSVSRKWGIFQVKHHFKDQADPVLILMSAKQLARTASVDLPDWTFHLNYPGIGFGGLEKSQVKNLVSCLPDNVHIWEF